jgi:hypothetical protein
MTRMPLVQAISGAPGGLAPDIDGQNQAAIAVPLSIGDLGIACRHGVLAFAY